ncbi:MAG: serine hydrolase [bacterium]
MVKSCPFLKIFIIFLVSFISMQLFADFNEEIDNLVQTYTDQNKFMGSVLVVKDDQIIISKGYGFADIAHQIENNPQTCFRIGSVTKQFTAAAILLLQEQGLISVHDPISRYIPDYPRGDEITIHHLLTHTSGIPNFTDFENFQDIMKQDFDIDEILDLFKYEHLDFSPGEKYNYSNSGYLVLSKIIEVVSEMTYSEFMQQSIFSPLGLEHTGVDDYYTIVPGKAEGYIFYDGEYIYDDYVSMTFPLGGGAIYSTGEDLLKWEKALHTEQLLSEYSQQLMFSSHAVISRDDPVKYYGYGWIITETDHGIRYGHSGGIQGFVCNISSYLDHDLVIIILSNNSLSPIFEILQSITAIVFNEPYQLPQEYVEIDLDPQEYRKFIGTYQYEDEIQLIVSVDDQSIYINPPGEPIAELYPLSETQFFLKVVDATVEFILENGEVQGMNFRQMGVDHYFEKID